MWQESPLVRSLSVHSARTFPQLPRAHSRTDLPACQATPHLAAKADSGLLERRYAIAAQYNAQGVCVFDRDQRLVLANDQYSKIYGLDPEQILVGMSLREILTLRIETGIYGSNGPAAYKREWIRNVTRRKTRIQDLNDGRSILIVRQPTNNGHWIATHEDITERLRLEAEAAHLAVSDPLTKLANRAALMVRLGQALGQLASRELACVMLIDLDHFKPVNDTYGHDIGDEVLKIAASRIRCRVRDTDVVARLGGDEFVVLQAPVSDPARARPLAERLIQTLATPFSTGAGEVVIGATIGVAITAAQTTCPDEFLKAADIALYAAKDAGRGTYRISNLTHNTTTKTKTAAA